MFVSDLRPEEYQTFREHVERFGRKNPKAVSYDYPISFNRREYLLRIQFTHKINIVALQAYSLATNLLITDNQLLSSMLNLLFLEIIHDPIEQGSDNLFHTYEGFLGSKQPNKIVPDFLCWISTAQTIRFKLTHKSYLLDEYLSLLFFGFQSNPIDNVVYEASDTANQLFLSIRKTLDLSIDEEPSTSSMEWLEEEMENQPLSCQEVGTKISYYLSLFLHNTFEDSYAAFYNQAKPREVEFDIVKIRELYKEISILLGENSFLIHQLNEELYRVFMIITPAEIYAKHFSESLLGSLTTRDSESNKLIFQLMLDHSIEA